MNTAIISIIAIFISAVSLTLSAYSVFRDRRRLKSWAYISHEADNKPSLRFMFVNNGRRPIYLKRLCFSYHSGIVFQPFKHPQPKVDDNNFLVEIPSLLAHTSYIRLDEGEVYEVMYKVDDWADLLNTYSQTIEYAESIWVECVEEKKYKIYHSMKYYKKLMKLTSGFTDRE